MLKKEISPTFRERSIKKLHHIACCLLVLGSLLTVLNAEAHDGFTRQSIAGTWVFSADGEIVSTGVPITLVGLSTFSTPIRYSRRRFGAFGVISSSMTRKPVRSCRSQNSPLTSGHGQRPLP